MEYAAFDIEIAAEIPSGCNDITPYRPLGITCAATLSVSPEGREERRWHGAEQADGRLADRMTARECWELAAYLLDMDLKGYQIVTWNGLGFDFDVLAEEVTDPVMWQDLRNLALEHIDPAFQMLCEKGFMCGLEAAAKGMGLGEKFGGVHGKDAPVLWQKNRAEQDLVLDYCAQDVALTAAVYDAIVGRGNMSWVKKNGGTGSWQPHFYPDQRDRQRLLTVTEANTLPTPDTLWLNNPWPRSKFIGWTEHPPQRQAPAATLTVLDALVVALADARAKEDAARHQTESIGDQIEQTELGQALATARRAWDEARQATTAADGALRTAALVAWDGNKHPHQAVEIAERTEVQCAPGRAVEIAVDLGWVDCLQIKAREFNKRALAMAEARAKVPALLGEVAPDIEFQVTHLLTLEGVEIVKAPMVKVDRDLGAWASISQGELPIEEVPSE